MLSHAWDNSLSCHTACCAVRGKRRAWGAAAAILHALSAWWRVRALGGPPDRGFHPNRVLAHAGVVEDERARRTAAARAHAEELGALHSKPPAAWPPALRSLVSQREAAAAAVRALQIVNSRNTSGLEKVCVQVLNCVRRSGCLPSDGRPTQ